MVRRDFIDFKQWERTVGEFDRGRLWLGICNMHERCNFDYFAFM
jgi:hypothetical protein